MVNEIFDNRGQGPDELNLIKKNMRLPGEINPQDFEGRFDFLIVQLFEVLSVERIFKVKKNLVG